MDNRSPLPRPRLRLPGQAVPICRDPSRGPGATAMTDRGVDAARSRCSQLQGLAQQMCYATEYGIST